jgi:hypothetical protein
VALAEVEEGFRQMREYLQSWALFSDWCESRGLAPAA